MSQCFLVRIFGPIQNVQKRIDVTRSKSDYSEDNKPSFSFGIQLYLNAVCQIGNSVRQNRVIEAY